MNLESLKAYAKTAENPSFNGALNSARTLFGTRNPDGTTEKGTLDTLEDALDQVPHGATPGVTGIMQSLSYHLGGKSMAPVKTAMADVPTELSNFMGAPGGHQTDMRLKVAGEQIRTADTVEQLREAVRTVRQLSAERMHGIAGQNPFARNMMQDIADPTARLKTSPVNPSGQVPGFKATHQLNGKGIGVVGNKWVYADGTPAQ